MNRVTALLGCEVPILQAPMSWVSRSALVAATCEAGGFGILETGSGDLVASTAEAEALATLTSRRFGVNLPLNLLRSRGTDIGLFLERLHALGVQALTTSAGDPRDIIPMLKAGGFTVLHVVGTLHAALIAEAAGADALIVEGNEGGGFKQPGGPSTFVVVPAVVERAEVPVIAAGGIVDGLTMAAAFALGAEGVQLGTALLVAEESPLHPRVKAALLAAGETDTVMLNQHAKPGIRALRTPRSMALLEAGATVTMAEFDRAAELYFDGNLDACVLGCGQGIGRITSIRSVRAIIGDMMTECAGAVRRLSADAAGTYEAVASR